MHPEFQERVIGQKKREEQGVSAKKEEKKKALTLLRAENVSSTTVSHKGGIETSKNRFSL